MTRNNVRAFIWLGVLGCALLLAGCRATTTSATTPSTPTTVAPTSTISTSTPPGPPRPVLATVQAGGCNWLGPNCATYLIWSDGTFELFRTTDSRAAPDGLLDELALAQPEQSGHLSKDAIQNLTRVIADTDFPRLLASLGPGQCLACVDGVDTMLIMPIGDQVESLNSVSVAFEPELPIFAAVAEAEKAHAGDNAAAVPAALDKTGVPAQNTQFSRNNAQIPECPGSAHIERPTGSIRLR